MLKIWYAKIDLSINLNHNLPPVILDHLALKKNLKAYQESLFVWCLLDELMKKTWGCSLNDCHLWFSQNGKPFCDKGYFSLSHSGNLGCVALSDESTGIDLEKYVANPKRQKLAKCLLKEKDVDDLLDSFYQTYTIYEASLKYLDQPLGFPKHQLALVEAYQTDKIIVNNDLYYLSYRKQNEVTIEMYEKNKF